MKIYLDCIPCFFKQALTAAKIAGLNDAKTKTILDHIAKVIPEIPLHSTPPEIGMIVYKAIYQASGIEDPFEDAKHSITQYLLGIYENLRQQVLSSDDPLYAALKLSAMGNAIDYGADPDFDIKDDILNMQNTDFEVYDYAQFKEELEKAKSILFIADNAGETVMDKLLIEQLKKKVIYAVRSRPIINDATIDDAREAGIQEVADIASSGCDAPGTILHLCTDDFLQIFNNAGMVISKGQGNYETLSEEKRLIFFLLKVKCPVIAADMNITTGNLVLLSNQRAIQSEP
jgi:uncharacterized protein with ATP-grasp and redox domains